MLLGPMGPASVPPSRSGAARANPRGYWFPAIMASNGSGRPPGTYGMITLALLGLLSMDAYETRRDNQKPLQLESGLLKKREGVFCRSHAALVSVWGKTLP